MTSLPRSHTRRNRRASALGGSRWHVLPYAMILPLMILVIGLSVIPAAASLVGSFYRNSALSGDHAFVGLRNYTTALEQSTAITTLTNTMGYMLIGTVGCVAVGTVFALFLHHSERKWLRGAVFGIVIAPWAVPPVVGAVVWRLIYDPTVGVLNSFLHSIGIIDSYRLWVGLHRALSVSLIELVQIWQLAPLAGLIIFAAMQGLPKDVYEAAAIDGAGSWRTFFTITLQLLRPAMAIAAIQSAILTFNIFDQVYIMNGYATVGNSLMEQVYNVAFTQEDFGQGYALSIIATLGTAIVSLVILGLVYRRVEH